jgi:hypothetical protein
MPCCLKAYNAGNARILRASVQTHANSTLLLNCLDRWRDLARKGACDPVKKLPFGSLSF